MPFYLKIIGPRKDGLEAFIVEKLENFAGCFLFGDRLHIFF